MCCMCECDCRYAGLRRTLQRRLGHRTEQDVLYLILQRPILLPQKVLYPFSAKQTPKNFNFLHPFLVCPISLQFTKFWRCSVTGVFPFTVGPWGTENSVVRSLLSENSVSMDWMSVPAGTDNYAFPALFSVPKGRKITPSYSNGRQNIVLSIRQLITCVVQQFSRLTKSIRNPQRCDSCSVSVGVGTPLIARLL